jgi:hypothetical protein
MLWRRDIYLFSPMDIRAIAGMRRAASGHRMVGPGFLSAR